MRHARSSFVKEIDQDGTHGWKQSAEPVHPVKTIRFSGVGYDRPIAPKRPRRQQLLRRTSAWHLHR
jgi:hypothetical protein